MRKSKKGRKKGIRRQSQTQLMVPLKKFPNKGYQPTSGKII